MSCAAEQRDFATHARHIRALLLGYYTEDGRLHYAGRAGTGFNGEGAGAPGGAS